MPTATDETRLTFWQRLKLWARAIDEAVHTTEAELVANRVVYLEKRIAKLEAVVLQATPAVAAAPNHDQPGS